MSKVAIVTDSNSGITQAEGKELDIFVVPMPFYINGKLYYEEKDTFAGRVLSASQREG